MAAHEPSDTLILVGHSADSSFMGATSPPLIASYSINYPQIKWALSISGLTGAKFMDVALSSNGKEVIAHTDGATISTSFIFII